MATFGPTSYALRPDLRALAVHVAAKFNCSWNTYEDHPPGLGLDAVSVDFWGPRGRGHKLGRLRRARISRYLRRRGGSPYWRWVINGSKGYYPGGQRFRAPGGALWNAGHVHLTVW